MTLLVALSLGLGIGLAVAGAAIHRGWPAARRAAFACWALALLLQLWWMALGALAFYKFVVLRQDT